MSRPGTVFAAGSDTVPPTPRERGPFSAAPGLAVKAAVLAALLVSLVGCKFEDWTHIKPKPPACSYTYTDWTVLCTDGKQTRTVTATPEGCTGTPEATERTCETPAEPAKDAIPIGEIVFSGGNPSGYKLTATMGTVTITGGTSGAVKICTTWTAPSPAWPAYTKGVMGNDWIGFKDASGKVQMGVWEMSRGEASVCRTSEAKTGEPPLIQAHGPVGSWTPTSGAEVYYMRTTITRGSDAASDKRRERTQVVKAVWP